MPKQQPTVPDEPWRDSPAGWFVVLERARETNDYEAAGRALRELRRLGVIVKYRPRKRRPDPLNTTRKETGDA
ncbi:MAG: hypothetical protein L0Y44_01305 [Phycisphaerales bacterium]|nr:hypothetical protein [Phycisphaerales bacterium]MCI0674942.1 hypothetical protein [Phycisphaerales bacterium]